MSERVECPVCDKSVPLRRNGAMREHRYHGEHICSGSGKRPDELTGHDS